MMRILKAFNTYTEEISVDTKTKQPVFAFTLYNHKWTPIFKSNNIERILARGIKHVKEYGTDVYICRWGGGKQDEFIRVFLDKKYGAVVWQRSDLIRAEREREMMRKKEQLAEEKQNAKRK